MPSHPRRGDHYEWFSSYLDARHTTPAVRALMAGIALMMSTAVLVLILDLEQPQHFPRLAMMWFAFGGGLAGAALWVWRWPTRAQSMLFAALTSASIAAICLAYPDPLAALLGCIAFATNGAYLAFFHSTRLVLINFVVAALVGTSKAMMIAAEGRTALAVVDLFLVLQINIVMPLAIQVLLRALEGDLKYADLDPLTGLLNRRAFRRQTLNMIARRGDEDHYLIVALADLDDFKSVNDTHGHLAGDRALVAVAEALRANVTPTAVVARTGGEEFLIADVAPSHRTVSTYQDICDAIASLSAQITASVGTVYTALDSVSRRPMEAVVDHLVAAADVAMYTAKRKGGNQCHHHGAWPGPESAWMAPDPATGATPP
ncbi:diguanylate cyclase [Mycobacterium sp. SMC-4]|uniref:GGDEF domain-containing protein n=1 Tax=Mycobacterium sp. SMC-4 TaxID=2857059 RepID=UPI0021B1C6E0|nr:GGDEF domain-containing protein [Mycobacterium sp. SMC-4]UXA17161.1 GGDEF domain-containing protein [Mycobacterium sp. SMC-4]